MAARARKISFMRYFWPALSFSLAMALLAVSYENYLLKDQRTLYQKVIAAQDGWCRHIMDVSYEYEWVLVDILQRLGLDKEQMPLMTTLLWRRASGNARVSDIRRLWGATNPSDGFLQMKDVLPDDPEIKIDAPADTP